MSVEISSTAKAVAGFGMAMGVAGLASDVEAAVVELTVSGSIGVGSSGTLDLSNSSFFGSLFGWNDAIGQTLYGSSGIASVAAVTVGASITVGQFSTSSAYGPGAGVATTALYGFLTTSGNIGWFEISFGGNTGPTTLLSAALETDAGVAITAGALPVPVPLPASIALLGSALGLAGGAAAIRRRRKEKLAA